MDYFSGFSWAVPRAFADAVAKCRFEEGDVLYDTVVAYEKEWDDAKEKVTASLQVKYPDKSAGSIAGEHGSQFRANWDSELRLELYENHKQNALGQIHTTHGRLYSMLWTDNRGILDTSTDEPSVPLFLTDTAKCIHQSRNVATDVADGEPIFVMAIDRSSQISQLKIRGIVAFLGNHLSELIVKNPERSGLLKHTQIAPSVEIGFFKTSGLSRDELHDRVKRAVYQPNKDAKKDMFRISRHGAIF